MQDAIEVGKQASVRSGATAASAGSSETSGASDPAECRCPLPATPPANASSSGSSGAYACPPDLAVLLLEGTAMANATAGPGAARASNSSATVTSAVCVPPPAYDPLAKVLSFSACFGPTCLPGPMRAALRQQLPAADAGSGTAGALPAAALDLTATLLLPAAASGALLHLLPAGSRVSVRLLNPHGLPVVGANALVVGAVGQAAAVSPARMATWTVGAVGNMPAAGLRGIALRFALTFGPEFISQLPSSASSGSAAAADPAAVATATTAAPTSGLLSLLATVQQQPAPSAATATAVAASQQKQRQQHPGGVVSSTRVRVAGLVVGSRQQLEELGQVLGSDATASVTSHSVSLLLAYDTTGTAGCGNASFTAALQKQVAPVFGAAAKDVRIINCTHGIVQLEPGAAAAAASAAMAAALVRASSSAGGADGPTAATNLLPVRATGNACAPLSGIPAAGQAAASLGGAGGRKAGTDKERRGAVAAVNFEPLLTVNHRCAALYSIQLDVPSLSSVRAPVGRWAAAQAAAQAAAAEADAAAATAAGAAGRKLQQQQQAKVQQAVQSEEGLHAVAHHLLMDWCQQQQRENEASGSGDAARVPVCLGPAGPLQIASTRLALSLTVPTDAAAVAAAAAASVKAAAGRSSSSTTSKTGRPGSSGAAAAKAAGAAAATAGSSRSGSSTTTAAPSVTKPKDAPTVSATTATTSGTSSSTAGSSSSGKAGSIGSAAADTGAHARIDAAGDADAVINPIDAALMNLAKKGEEDNVWGWEEGSATSDDPEVPAAVDHGSHHNRTVSDHNTTSSSSDQDLDDSDDTGGVDDDTFVRTQDKVPGGAGGSSSAGAGSSSTTGRKRGRSARAQATSARGIKPAASSAAKAASKTGSAAAAGAAAAAAGQRQGSSSTSKDRSAQRITTQQQQAQQQQQQRRMSLEQEVLSPAAELACKAAHARLLERLGMYFGWSAMLEVEAPVCQTVEAAAAAVAAAAAAAEAEAAAAAGAAAPAPAPAPSQQQQAALGGTAGESGQQQLMKMARLAAQRMRLPQRHQQLAVGATVVGLVLMVVLGTLIFRRSVHRKAAADGEPPEHQPLAASESSPRSEDKHVLVMPSGYAPLATPTRRATPSRPAAASGASDGVPRTPAVAGRGTPGSAQHTQARQNIMETPSARLPALSTPHRRTVHTPAAGVSAGNPAEIAGAPAMETPVSSKGTGPRPPASVATKTRLSQMSGGVSASMVQEGPQDAHHVTPRRHLDGDDHSNARRGEGSLWGQLWK